MFINDTYIKKQTGLNSSNIISVVDVAPTHPNAGSGFNYFLSGWRTYTGRMLGISMLCKNNGNPNDHPVHFDIYLKMLNKLI